MKNQGRLHARLFLLGAGLLTLGEASGGAAWASTEKIVLRLPLRGRWAKPWPRSVSVSQDEGFSIGPSFAGVDGRGNVYIVDRVDDDWALKCFDKKGRFRTQWALHTSGVGSSTVSPDGHVWLSVETERRPIGSLPVVAYQLGHPKPVADWRVQVPTPVRKVMVAAVRAQNLKWPRSLNRDVSVELRSGGNLLHAMVLGDDSEVIGETHLSRQLWMIGSADGSRAIASAYFSYSNRDQTPTLMVDGTLWGIATNWDAKQPGSTLSKFWLWQRGRPRGAPLLDLASRHLPQQARARLVRGSCPYDEQVDRKGHIYLFWRDGGDGGAAVMVLDKARRLISCPWKSNPYATADWIKPRADGTGFYRMAFFKKEARIYFHPLP